MTWNRLATLCGNDLFICGSVHIQQRNYYQKYLFSKRKLGVNFFKWLQRLRIFQVWILNFQFNIKVLKFKISSTIEGKIKIICWIIDIQIIDHIARKLKITDPWAIFSKIFLIFFKKILLHCGIFARKCL